MERKETKVNKAFKALRAQAIRELRQPQELKAIKVLEDQAVLKAQQERVIKAIRELRQPQELKATKEQLALLELNLHLIRQRPIKTKTMEIFGSIMLTLLPLRSYTLTIKTVMETTFKLGEQHSMTLLMLPEIMDTLP
jgi:hypothetical protein